MSSNFLATLEPYGYFVLPHSPYEPDHSGFPAPQTLAANSTWRLATDEAIVVLGCTPPEARYYGLTGYVVGACPCMPPRVMKRNER